MTQTRGRPTDLGILGMGALQFGLWPLAFGLRAKRAAILAMAGALVGLAVPGLAADPTPASANGVATAPANAKAKRLRIPNFNPYEYRQTRRDPFLDPSVEVTILGAAKKQEFGERAKPMEAYVDELQALVAQQYAVQGIAYDGVSPMALMGGKVCRASEKLAVKLPAPENKDVALGSAAKPKSLTDRLYATSRFYGLGIEDELRAGKIRMTVKKVGTTAVLLSVPGTARELLVPFQKDESVETTNFASTYSAAKGKTATKTAAPKPAVPAANASSRPNPGK